MKPTKNAIKTLIALTILLLVVGFESHAIMQSYTISPAPFGLVQDNSGHVVNGGCVWTYVAGTTTAATTYSDNAGTPNTNPIKADSAGRFTAFLQTGLSYKFVYENIPCTVSPPVHGSVLRTADNISATPTSSANQDISGQVAGETLTAGQAVYLSAGLGGKTQGQWYKADSTNAYSSTIPTVGMVPATIASGASGVVRISGYMTGLSSLTQGSDYYLTTGGAITSSVGGRFIGKADTTTTLILTPNPFPAAVDPSDCTCRLTLTTATPVTTTNVTSAATLFLTPYKGNRISLFDGLATWVSFSLSEVSVAVPATTSQMYDVFAFNSSGTPAIEVLAWTNDTTRATALTLQNGAWVKTGATTRKYVGSFRTTTSSGTTEDSLTKRYVWNYFNRVPRIVQRLETTGSWTYTTATLRQANNSTSNQVEVVEGLAEDILDLSLQVQAANDTAANTIVATFGVDTTTAQSALQIGGNNKTPGANLFAQVHSHLTVNPAIGRHFYAWLEWSVAAGTTTWYGFHGQNLEQSGITGIWWS